MDTTKFKVNSLKVYSDNEWLFNAKKYRTVFEEQKIKYIYAEFSFYNKLFDESDWNINVRLKAYDAKGTVLCDQDASMLVKKTDNIVYIRKGWGMDTAGAYWKKGTYRWEALVDGQVIAAQYFYIENEGEVNDSQNPYFDITVIRLYEADDKFIPLGERKYLKTFDVKAARFVWFEFEAENNVKDDWACEIFFNFKNDAGEHKGNDNKFKIIKSSDGKITFGGGWGNGAPGSWNKGWYYLEVMFMEHMIARVPFLMGDENEEAEDDYYLKSAEKQPVTLKKESKSDISYEEAIKELNALIGLTEIKTSISEFADYLKFVKIRQEKGLTENTGFNLHAVFSGNPGTGKTTVALLLGKIYKSLGLLSKGHVHEVDRADIIGEYIGHTAPKVKAAIKKARGGILFIDEAYSLTRSDEDSRDFGREAIEIILKEMSDGDGDIAIIAAGYPKEMQNFIASNPGLKSRFGMHYHFPDYVPQELMLIADTTANKKSLVIQQPARELIYKYLVEGYRTRDSSFGNARYANSIVEEAKMNMGLRLVKMKNLNELTAEQLSTITLEDVQKVFANKEGIRPDIPLDEDYLHSSLAKLKSLIGITNIVKEIEEIVKLAKYEKELGKDIRKSFSLHMIFTGNPGTGKTTVARIIADIYKALGILEKGHLVEVDRERLIGTYIGHTAQKTADAINESMGGVLFIDEAYALTSGGENDFGREAVEIILKRMEDKRGQFAIIAAGYPDNMEEFLRSNPGIKSRFDKVLHFDDYDAEEMFAIAELMYSQNNMKLDAQAAEHLKQYFDFLDKSRDKYFGNAREVRKIVEESTKNHHLRVADIPKESRSTDVLKYIILQDVSEFQVGKLKVKQSIGFTI